MSVSYPPGGGERVLPYGGRSFGYAQDRLWGRNLSYHPHVHCLVPAGGLAADGQIWLPARKNFLLPVKALSRIFRASSATPCARLSALPTSRRRYGNRPACRQTGVGGALADGKVTFRYRASDTGKLKTCTLPAEEFIRRFLQHVLPKGFVKVRYYGFLSSGPAPTVGQFSR